MNDAIRCPHVRHVCLSSEGDVVFWSTMGETAEADAAISAQFMCDARNPVKVHAHKDGVTVLQSWGQLLISGGLDGLVKIWNFHEKELRELGVINVMSPPRSIVTAGERLIVCTDDRRVFVVTWADGQVRNVDWLSGVEADDLAVCSDKLICLQLPSTISEHSLSGGRGRRLQLSRSGFSAVRASVNGSYACVLSSHYSRPSLLCQFGDEIKQLYDISGAEDGIFVADGREIIVILDNCGIGSVYIDRNDVTKEIVRFSHPIWEVSVASSKRLLACIDTVGNIYIREF